MSFGTTYSISVLRDGHWRVVSERGDRTAAAFEFSSLQRSRGADRVRIKERASRLLTSEELEQQAKEPAYRERRHHYKTPDPREFEA